MNSKCDACLWNDQCYSDYDCSHFTPLVVDYDELVELRRYEFRTEFCEYLEEDEGV